jgi:hypothetical protein
MTIVSLSAAAALSRIAVSLRVGVPAGDGLRASTIAQALRRACYVLAPCSRSDLARGVSTSFAGLGGDGDEVRAEVDEILEALLVYGDLLEMRPSDADDWRTSDFVLRPAPPTFVRRSDGSIVILGVAGDEITPLTGEMTSQIVEHGVLRTLEARTDFDLAAFLKDSGLIEISERSWLRSPQQESAASYAAAWLRRLADRPSSDAESVRVLDGHKPADYYAGRWSEAAGHTGFFVGRRGQQYGAELWCLVELDGGGVRRFLDFVSVGDRVRPCDVAWRVQMALDAAAGNPQRMSVRSVSGDRAILDFFSPLPSWAERRLTVSGTKVDRERCLLSYSLPSARLASELEFLKNFLWLEQTAR